jgi:hypothetical protein
MTKNRFNPFLRTASAAKRPNEFHPLEASKESLKLLFFITGSRASPSSVERPNGFHPLETSKESLKLLFFITGSRASPWSRSGRYPMKGDLIY